jgi:hypothetical protein
MKVKYLLGNDNVSTIETATCVTPLENANKALIEWVTSEGKNTSTIINSNRLLSITIAEEK